MAPSDDDIQFDFFDDEPVTAEAAAQPRGRMPQRTGARRSRRLGGGGSSPPSAKPLVTLGAIVFCVLFIVLMFSVVIASCAGESRHAQYANYIDKVTTIASQSTRDGQLTVQALTTPGLSVPSMVTKLKAIAAAEQQNVSAAQSLSAPGRLRDENGHLVEALELRVSGVSGLATAFNATIGSKTSESVEASSLSQQAYRLLASDIVWQDLFQAPALDQIDHDGVRQVTPPGSKFLSDPDSFVSVKAMSLVLERISGTSGSTKTPSGLHGTNLVSVAALPNGPGGSSEVLTAGQLNTVTTSSSLVFQVTIADGGISQEVGIPVTLTIGRAASSGGPIIKTEKIRLIDPGSTASVTFSDLGEVPFAAKTTVSVDVKGVPGETNLKNNSAQYDVIFSLPS